MDTKRASEQVGWMDNEGPVTVPPGRPDDEHNNDRGAAIERDMLALLAHVRAYMPPAWRPRNQTHVAVPVVLLDHIIAILEEVTPTEQPKDYRGEGRLILNGYGRRCFEAGYNAAKEDAERERRIATMHRQADDAVERIKRAERGAVYSPEVERELDDNFKP